MRLQEIQKFLQAALECSVYFAPREPGLTHEEIIQVAQRVGFQPGETGDALSQIVTQYFGDGARKLLPCSNAMRMWGLFGIAMEPDYRNPAAFDFVTSALNASLRAEGAGNARLERSVIVERAVSENISRSDIEAAITLLVLSNQLVENGGFLHFACKGEHPLPGEQWRALANRRRPTRDELRVRAHELVKDVIERRTDGRPRHAEPLNAFAEELDKLGYARFRLWWIQTVAELRHLDTQSSPVAVSVLAAALLEGALTFVVKHARELGLGVFGSTDFQKDPRTWKIDDLVSGAAAGKDTAILDVQTRNRAAELIRVRQRIHAGRMLHDFPGVSDLVPDLRPEEARGARDTADLVVRRVLDWLQRYPASGTRPPKN